MSKKYKLIKEKLDLSGGSNEKITIIEEKLKLLSIDEKNTFCKEDLNNYNIYIGLQKIS